MKLFRLLTAVLCVFLLCSCSSKTAEKSVETKKDESENVRKKSIEVANLYSDFYLKAEKTKSDFFPYDVELKREDIDAIEDFLCKKGISVINTDEKYPDYLENTKDFEDVKKKQSFFDDKNVDFVKISGNGNLLYTSFGIDNDKLYKTNVTIAFNEKNVPEIVSEDKYEVLDWEITDNDFYYQTALKGVPYDDYVGLRLKPVDKEMYDYNLKYIVPIGYSGNNMFVTEWEAPNYENLCFNDTFEYLYRVKNNEDLKTNDFEKVRGNEIYFCVLANLFEETILPYFDVPINTFKEKCLYDISKNTYPYQEIGGENLSLYSRMDGEVKEIRTNNDGTFTLVVNVRCNEYKTDCLFTHEVTVKKISENEYKYLKNKITYKSEHEFPPTKSRMIMQR